MKTLLLLSVCLLFLLHPSFAQVAKDIPAFGRVEMAELSMNDCAFAPGAAAMHLLQYEEVTLTVNPNSTTEVVTVTRCRIKILNKNGFNYATVNIDFDKDESKVSDIEAAAYNLDENGQIRVSPVDKSDIFKTNATKDERKISFTFPNVKEGTVLEYQYTRKDKRSYIIPAWYFQNSIPNLLSVCKITRPYTSLLEKKVISDRHMEEDSVIEYARGSDKKLLTNYYAMRNIPAFRPEPFMSSSRDSRYLIDFLTYPDESAYHRFISMYGNIWQAANDWLYYSDYFGGQFIAPVPGTKKFVDSVKKLDETGVKINAVYKYVKQKLKWNNYYSLFSREMKDVWNEGEGSSAEINLAILNLLRKCGVNCYPVLYSTRLHGMVDYEFADMSQFNTVNIAVVNGKQFELLDGTNAHLGYHTPPLNVVNRTGLLVDAISHTKINVDFDRKLLWDSVYVYASVGTDGMLRGKIVKKYFDLSKSLKLQSQDKREDNDEDSKTVAAVVQDIKIDSSYQQDAESDLLPLTEVSTFHYELPSTNDFYFLDPFLFSSLSKNPFTATDRKTDIDFIANTASVVHIEIALPASIKLEELTKKKEILPEDNSLAFRMQTALKDNIIYINSSFEIARPIFEKWEYPALKSNFDKIYSLLNSQLLLRKKGN